MNKKILFLVVIVLIGIAGFSYYSSMKPVATDTSDISQMDMSSEPVPSNFTSTTTTQTSGGVVTSKTTVTVTPIQTVSVSISGFAFSPKTIEVKAGDTVVWTNNDGAPHTVTSVTGTELSSENLGKGDTYSHTFTKAGTYNYYCAIHPGMKGTVVVR